MKKISIIIPVYNNFELTLQCINSIKKHCREDFYEIIVSDDNSIDDTKKFFESQDEIKYIRNKENRGFSFTCNRGAEVARGKYLLFLNNDTLLIDDILTKFLKTFEKHPEVGIIGAKLLYPDNTIQHAGVIIYPDKKLDHFLRYFPSDYPAANKIRELDIVTGACFGVKKDLFFKLGKFNEKFFNGFEDVDFCIRARVNGYKILYNPEITLYHLEEKTRKRNKQREKKNSKVLNSIWREKNLPEPSIYIFEEGFDYKFRELGFYIVKRENQKIRHQEDYLIKLINKEPLNFDAFKALIYIYVEEKNYEKALYFALELIKFEPLIENYQIIKRILELKKDFEKASKIKKLINEFIQDSIKLSYWAKYWAKYYIDIKNHKMANYFLEWLKNFH